MIFAHLKQHWLARRSQYSLTSWILCILRTSRVLMYYRDHQALCQLDVVRNYVALPPNDDLFHHLSHRDYLVKGLSPRQRVQCALAHYNFEETTFNAAYKQAVYCDGGLVLWEHQHEDHRFLIRLDMASRANAEGDLTLSLVADGKCLHRLSFSWMDGAMAGVQAPLVPFIARNQGRWTDSGEAFEAFEQVFPNNSPSFFCFAAMQGVAQAVGMDQVVAIKCTAHIAYDPDEVKHFANAYDGFWKILGGVEMPGNTWLIALPFYLKPLADMPSKHRKRAAQRREHWRVIGESARGTLQRHLLHARAHQEHAAPVREPAEA
ncbi:VirK/YbjX family protein [Massilia solisilvae]|uniref:VirK/YbjX family protein n=1 Tax=Massilia solisilvae TaxID=1811225 RepID=A0ABT2BG45_9BURK|nr:VirK/YbjX family protein [Massilia solisilvae]MCS0607497.1 VirK/YbjX family protein [Massilia solisilvae]